MADVDVRSDSGSTTSDPLDTRDDEGWQDIESDHEISSFISLFDDKVFNDVNELLQYCQNNYDFDFKRIRKELDLDFLASVKLVNYVRSMAQAGNRRPDVSSRTLFDDETYLKPVLEDDALLYSLDDIVDDRDNPAMYKDNHLASSQVEELRGDLARLQSQFAAYREEVQKTLTRRLEEDLTRPAGPSPDKGLASVPEAERGKATAKKADYPSLPGIVSDEATEAGYFSSYSYNEIHESMLKDTVRTDAYRDFIYDNKHLFADKVVLDVGCGTGILSMFCAKAGAKNVIAVDNSDIIDKARQNVFQNGFQNTIRCLRGKIEEVTMPVPKVDIIVSEWMGYCLLYESMLDSVIYARDKYLSTDGLMVPSHACLRISTLADSELVISHVDFWKNVYNFQMTSMLENVYDEALIRSVEPKDLASESVGFLELDLHTAKTTDLTFVNPFQLYWKKGFERLEGFVIWFDIYFMRSRHDPVTKSMTPKQASQKSLVAFTTGPDAIQTHWQQGALLVKEPYATLREGEVITGRIGYQRKEGQERSLDVEVQWKYSSALETRRQVWSLN